MSNFNPRHNVRFWKWVHNGWVKITLRPDQELHWEIGWRTDEGWHWEGHTWTYDASRGVVCASMATEACDCDGRLDHYWDGESVEYDDEFVDQEDGQPYRRLRYRTSQRSQHDYAAAAAGY